MPKPDSEVVKSLRQFRARMDGVDDALMRDMGTRWLSIERALNSNIAALAEEMARRTAAGETISQGMVWKAERYQILKSQMNDEILKYNKDFAVDTIASAQERAATLGIEAAQEALVASYPSPLSATFNRVNISAVESMIGFAGDGSPLNTLLKNDYPDAYNGLVDALVNGLSSGQGAAQIARDMTEGMGMGLDRALLIARTETNRSYRAGSIQQYRDSGVVAGFKRLAARDEACLACLILDGETLELESDLDDHPNGRCTCVPILNGMDPPDWETGQEWFANQDEAKQREILGGTRFDMWQNGTPLDAFAGKTHSDVWGDAPQIVSIKELMAEAHGNVLNITSEALSESDLAVQNKDAVLKYVDENNISAKRIIFKDTDITDEFGNTVLGQYQFDTRKVYIYPAGLNRSDAVETMVHEIAHLRADKSENFNPLKDSVFTKSWKKVTDFDDKPKYSTIKEKGEVSEYASDILKQFGKRDTDLVLNETWAELARLDHINQLDTVSPFWQNYYNEMKKAVKR